MRGRVLDGQQGPVANARLISGEGERLAESDTGGFFEIFGEELPEQMTVIHPGFETLTVSLDQEEISLAGREMEILLRKKASLVEEVTVTARVPLPGFAPVAAATATVEPADLPDLPAALLDVVGEVPGVSANGQGGMFQTYSIRGVSRHRVQSSILGARLAGERRAGVSTSFIDPFLYGAVDLLKGPASSIHGSGALGGAVRITPRKFQGYSLEMGYGSQGDELYTASGWGDGAWSMGFVRRESGDAEAPDGSLINSHFTQYSGLLSRVWDIGAGTAELSVMPALGLDIGKANTDFEKGKVTEYPEEKHLVTHLSFKLDSGWDISGFFHPHSVATEVRESDSLSRVKTDSFDSGIRVRKSLYRSENTFFSIGADHFSRIWVDSVENEWSSIFPSPSIPFYSLDGASQNETGLSGDITREFNGFSMEGGANYTRSRQVNQGFSARNDSAWNGYGGLVVPVSQGSEFKGSVGIGLRFPSLSELFYGGITGRGTVEGNPDLLPERAFILEGGLEWMGSRHVFIASAFRNRINDYIERIEADPVSNPDHLTYRNLTRGTIKGLEWELAANPVQPLNLFWRGHLMKGLDDSGNPLADIPVHRSTIGLRYGARNWTGGFSWQYRASMDEPGPGEKKTGAAGILSGFVRKPVSRSLEILVSGDNLTNREYYNSADKKVPLSAGRSVTVTLRWKLPGQEKVAPGSKPIAIR